MNQEEKNKEGGHYVCLGGCRTVADAPGTCQNDECLSRGAEMDKCDCEDRRHNGFKSSE